MWSNLFAYWQNTWWFREAQEVWKPVIGTFDCIVGVCSLIPFADATAGLLPKGSLTTLAVISHSQPTGQSCTNLIFVLHFLTDCSKIFQMFDFLGMSKFDNCLPLLNSFRSHIISTRAEGELRAHGMAGDAVAGQCHMWLQQGRIMLHHLTNSKCRGFAIEHLLETDN